MLMAAKIDTSGGSVAQPSRPRPQPTPSPSPSPSTSGSYYNSRLTAGDSGDGTVQGSAGTADAPTSYSDWRNNATRYDNTLPIGYNPPTTSYLSADRQEREVMRLPDVFKVQTVGDALNLYWGNSEARQTIIAAARAHYKGNPQFIDQWAQNYWLAIVNASNSPGAAAPWEMLQNDLMSAQGEKSGAGSSSSGGGGYRSYGGGGGGYSGGGGSGGLSRVDLTNPTTARGLLMQTMQQVLGRDPTDAEVREFTKTLSREETANPTTVVADATGVVQSGGTDPSMIALDYAKARDDFKSRQAGKYFNVFMSALGGGYSG